MSQWTKELEPIDDREVNSGELVELFVGVDSGVIETEDIPRIRFDILEEDFLLTGWTDDAVVSFVGTGAEPPSESDFSIHRKETEFIEIDEFDRVTSVVAAFRSDNFRELEDKILVMKTPDGAYTIVSWWMTERVFDSLNSEFYFIVNLNNQLDIQSETTIEVTEERKAVPEFGESVFVETFAMRESYAVSDDRANRFRFVSAEEAADEARSAEDAPPSHIGTGPSGGIRAGRLFFPAPQSAPVGDDLEAMEEVAGLGQRWLHPASDSEFDTLDPGPSPFSGQLLAIVNDWEKVEAQSDRFFICYDIRRAYRAGRMKFGGRTYAIVEGPLFTPDPAYYVVSTSHANAVEPINPDFPSHYVAGQWLPAIRSHFFATDFIANDGRRYSVRLLVDKTGLEVYGNGLLAEEHMYEVALRQRDYPAYAVLPQRLIDGVLSAIDSEVSGQNVETAAERLADLGVEAFAAMTAERKSEYLGILIDARTLQREEEAILAIFSSADSRPELEALIRAMGEARFREIFENVGNMRLFRLFGEVGRNVGHGREMTIHDLGNFLVDSGLLTQTITPVLVPGGFVLSADARTQLLAMAEGFMQLFVGIYDAIKMLVTQPDKVVLGIFQLIKLIVYWQLAQLPDVHPVAREARQTIQNIVQRVSRSVFNIYKGFVIIDKIATAGGFELRASSQMYQRIYWIIVVEVASWFVGIGEIRAGINILRSVDRVADTSRLVRAFDEVADVGRALGQLDEFAELARAPANLSRSDDVLRRLADLPPDDAATLQRALDNIDPDDLSRSSWDELLESHPQLRTAAERTLPRMELADDLTAKLYPELVDLQRALDAVDPSDFARLGWDELLESNPALRWSVEQLFPDPAELRRVIAAIEPEDLPRALPKVANRFPVPEQSLTGFHRLLDNSGLTPTQLRTLIQDLPPDNAEDFLRAIEVIHDAGRLGPARNQRGYGFLYALSQRPRATSYLLHEGYDGFTSIFRHVRSDWDQFQRHVDGLQTVRRHLLEQGEDYASFFRRYLDRDPLARLDHSAAMEAYEIATRAMGQRIDLPAQSMDDIYRAIISADERALRSRLYALTEGLAARGSTQEGLDFIASRVKARARSRQDRLRTAQTADIQAVRLAELRESPGHLEDAMSTSLEHLSPSGAKHRYIQDELVRIQSSSDEALALAGQLADDVGGSPTAVALVRDGAGDAVRQTWVDWRFYVQRRQGEISRWRTNPAGRRQPRDPLTFEEYARNRMARSWAGEIGEQQAAMVLANDQFLILKAPSGSSVPGTDLVAIDMRSGAVLLLDNKATHNYVDAVDALTRNLEQNIRFDIEHFENIVRQVDAQALPPGFSLPNGYHTSIDRLRRAQRELDEIIGPIRRELSIPGRSATEVERMVKGRLSLNMRNIQRRVLTDNPGLEGRALDEAVMNHIRGDPRLNEVLETQGRIGRVLERQGIYRVVTDAAAEVPGLHPALESMRFVLLNL